MSDIEIDGLDNINVTKAALEVESGLDNVDVTYDNSALIDVDPHEYYLTSTGIYTGRVESNVPDWIANYITEQLSTNSSIDNNSIIDALKGRVDDAEIGISQNLQSIQTTDLSLSSLETLLVSRLDGNDAAIYELQETSVTEDRALAIATDLQISTFGEDVKAYITGITTTFANANLAYASDYQALVATYAGLDTKIEDTREVVIGEYSEWNGVDTPLLGQFKYDAGQWYQYIGGTLGPLGDGWQVTPEASIKVDVDIADTAANRTVKAFSAILVSPPTAEGEGDLWTVTDQWYTASTGTTYSTTKTEHGRVLKRYTEGSWITVANEDRKEYANVAWAGYASSLLYDPVNGAITGWEYGDGGTVGGIDTRSEFKISADTFKVASGTTSLPVFTVDTVNNQVNFNGVVDFTNTNIVNGYAGTTTINGGLLETNTLDAAKITAGSIWASGTISGGTIEGGTIEGVNIIGAVIKASWIDYASTGHLTNWQYYGPTGVVESPIDYPDVPLAYIDNFAKDNTTSELIVDSLGYVRLPKVSKVITLADYSTIGGLGTNTLPDSYGGARSYDSYTSSDTERVLEQYPRFVLDNISDWLYYSADTDDEEFSCDGTVFIGSKTLRVTSASDPQITYFRIYVDGVLIVNTTSVDYPTAGVYTYDYTINGLGFRVSLTVWDVTPLEGFVAGVDTIKITPTTSDFTFTSPFAAGEDIGTSGVSVGYNRAGNTVTRDVPVMREVY